MAQTAEPNCAICTARGRSKRLQSNRMSRVTIKARTMTLCREHAGIVAIHMPKTWEELRALFSGPAERRSPVPRRAPSDDRRMFPPRPEGRRMADGRRKNDPSE